MKTFYIFKLNKEMRKISNKNPESIYMLLSSIYYHNRKDIITAFNLFDDICLPININFFNKYTYNKLYIYDEYTKFKSIHMYNNYFTNETSKMCIYKSFIRVKSNKNENIFNNNLLEIDNLFICDFVNNYYKVSKVKNFEN